MLGLWRLDELGCGCGLAVLAAVTWVLRQVGIIRGEEDPKIGDDGEGNGNSSPRRRRERRERQRGGEQNAT